MQDNMRENELDCFDRCGKTLLYIKVTFTFFSSQCPSGTDGNNTTLALATIIPPACPITLKTFIWSPAVVTKPHVHYLFLVFTFLTTWATTYLMFWLTVMCISRDIDLFCPVM